MKYDDPHVIIPSFWTLFKCIPFIFLKQKGIVWTEIWLLFLADHAAPKVLLLGHYEV